MIVYSFIRHQLARDHGLSVEITGTVTSSKDEANCPTVYRALPWCDVSQRFWIEP